MLVKQILYCGILTALSKIHGKKWCIWSQEKTDAGQLKRDIIQMWTGETIKDLK